MSMEKPRLGVLTDTETTLNNYNEEKIRIYGQPEDRNIFRKILYFIIGYSTFILCFFVFLLILIYLIIIGKFVNDKRATYTSVYKGNITEPSLGQFENASSLMGTVVFGFNIAIFLIYFLVFVFIIGIYYSNQKQNNIDIQQVWDYLKNGIPEDQDIEENIYKKIMLIILSIFSVLYLISFIYMMAYNPNKDVTDKIEKLQLEIYSKIDKPFFNYVLNTNIDTSLLFYETKNEKNEIIYKNILDDTVIEKDNLSIKLEELRKIQYDENINFDIATLYIKVNTWLYTDEYQKYIPKSIRESGVNMPIKPNQYSNSSATDDDIINYRFNILISSVIMIYYLNTNNIKPFVKNLQEPIEYKTNIFLYADSTANSILPPLSLLRTSPLYKAIKGPLNNASCDIARISDGKVITVFLTDDQVRKLEEKYETFKKTVDELFKQIKSADDPFGYKFSIIISIIIMFIYIAFAIQLFWWWRYKITFLKHWFWFLWYYGKLIILVIMLVLVI